MPNCKSLHTVLLVLLSFIFYTTTAQQNIIIKGVVKNKKTQVPVANANALIKTKDSLLVLYGLCNNKGEFAISLPDTLNIKNFFLEIAAVGYNTHYVSLDKNTLFYNVLLAEDTQQLKEVVVKTMVPINNKGDTLAFSVNAFERKEDVTIGDVIKRMPGITVNDNGSILYNGKPISNLYIQGDDLMDGKYGLATKAINKNIIKSVEVIQNHQPIKVLENKAFSNDVALNLVLKNNNNLNLTGNSTLGAGLPQLYYAELNTVLLNKKIKTLNSIKLNNTGINLRNEFKYYNQDNVLLKYNNNRPLKLLSLAAANTPEIDEQLYYNNNTGLVNINALVNTKDSLQLRTNLQFFKDANRLSFFNQDYYFINNDTVLYTQSQLTNNKEKLASINLTATLNKAKTYFTNKLNVNLSTENNFTTPNFNGVVFPQNLKNVVTDFVNNFTYIPTIKKQNLLSVNWYLNLYHINQNLWINAPIDSAILNNNKTYNSVTQQLYLPTFFSNLNFTYIFNSKSLITSSYEAGYIKEIQKNNATILITQTNNAITPYSNDNGNNLLWKRNRYYLSSNFGINKKNLKVSLTIPFNYQQISITDPSYNLNYNANQFFINPNVRTQLYVNSEDYIELSYQMLNNFNNINSMYRGLIITDYRTLQNNNNFLQEQFKNSFAVNYYFKRSLQMLFFNTGFRLYHNKLNTINNTTLNNGIIQNEQFNFNNLEQSVAINTEASKYFYKHKTKLSIQNFLIQNTFNRLLNGNNIKFKNNSFSFNINADVRLQKNINAFFKSSFTEAALHQLGDNNKFILHSRATVIDNNATINFSLNNLNIQLKLNNLLFKQLHQQSQQFWFADVNFKTRVKKTDLMLDVFNLFNVKNFTTIDVQSFVYTVNSFALRGRMILGKICFNF